MNLEFAFINRVLSTWDCVAKSDALPTRHATVRRSAAVLRPRFCRCQGWTKLALPK
jgi:hypothetical protein